MLQKTLLTFIVSVALFQFSNAQHIKIKMGFPSGVSINAPGPAPFSGAIWIGPEWRWERGQYVHVPGYWDRPKKRHHRWIPGHWEYSRRGYYWKPGHWK